MEKFDIRINQDQRQTLINAMQEYCLVKKSAPASDETALLEMLKFHLEPETLNDFTA
jgi:hypothetical protein